MKYQYTRLSFVLVILLSVFASSTFTTRATSLPSLGGHTASSVPASSNSFRLQIPSVNIDLAVVTAHFTGGTWDFSRILYQAGYFEGTPLPGAGGNVVIGAHSEFANRVPGPFFHLSDVRVGSQIVVAYHGQTYNYTVTSVWSVDPSDVSPVYSSDGEVLTLLTCSGYNDGVYQTRLVVRAQRSA